MVARRRLGGAGGSRDRPPQAGEHLERARARGVSAGCAKALGGSRTGAGQEPVPGAADPHRSIVPAGAAPLLRSAEARGTERGMRRTAWLLLSTLLLAPVPAAAVTQVTSNARVTISPPAVRLGERATYRATMVVEPGVRAQWLPPDTSSALTWGPRRAWRRSQYA